MQSADLSALDATTREDLYYYLQEEVKSIETATHNEGLVLEILTNAKDTPSIRQILFHSKDDKELSSLFKTEQQRGNNELLETLKKSRATLTEKVQEDTAYFRSIFTWNTDSEQPQRFRTLLDDLTDTLKLSSTQKVEGTEFPYIDKWCDPWTLNMIRSMTSERPLYGFDEMFTIACGQQYIGLNENVIYTDKTIVPKSNDRDELEVQYKKLSMKLLPTEEKIRFDAGMALLNAWSMSSTKFSILRDSFVSLNTSDASFRRDHLFYQRLFIPRIRLDNAFLAVVLTNFENSALARPSYELQYTVLEYEKIQDDIYLVKNQHTRSELKELLDGSSASEFFPKNLVRIDVAPSNHRENKQKTQIFLDHLDRYIYAPQFFHSNRLQFMELEFYYKLIGDITMIPPPPISPLLQLRKHKAEREKHDKMIEVEVTNFWADHLTQMINLFLSKYTSACRVLSNTVNPASVHRTNMPLSAILDVGLGASMNENYDNADMANLDIGKIKAELVDEKRNLFHREQLKTILWIEIEFRLMLRAFVSYIFKEQSNSPYRNPRYESIIQKVMLRFLNVNFAPELFVATFGHITMFETLGDFVKNPNYFFVQDLKMIKMTMKK